MKIIKFKTNRERKWWKFWDKSWLHDSGYRFIQVKGENGENLGSYHDVIYLRLGGVYGPWINIDCEEDGTFRIFTFPSPEGSEFDLGESEWTKLGSSLFIDVIGKRLPRVNP